MVRTRRHRAAEPMARSALSVFAPSRRIARALCRPGPFAVLAVTVLIIVPLASVLASRAAAAEGRGGGQGPDAFFTVDPGASRDDSQRGGAAPRERSRSDTLDFGSYQEIGGETYAVPGEIWTWDHGAPDPLEGWFAEDRTENWFVAFGHLTQESWEGHGNPPVAPVLSGVGSLWCGFFEDRADSLCWDAGLGYGNRWCQRLTSPTLTYTGTGSVGLAFSYFNDTEENYDYTHLYLVVGTERTALNGGGFTHRIGTPPTGPWAVGEWEITEEEFGGAGEPREFWLVFEMTSDSGWSDEDGDYTTEYGAFGADDLALTGSLGGGEQTFDFEDGLQGWTPAACPGSGSFLGVADLGQYVILDPCRCELAGSILEMHDDGGAHPEGQHEIAWSPPADRSALQAYNVILADWDMYAEMPQANGVFYRSGWNYYPYTCPVTGEAQWSGRTGIPTYYYAGDQPVCYGSRNVATDWGIPSGCDLIAFCFEIWASCDAFGIPPTVCTHVTNFTPIIDNVRIRMTQAPVAPRVTYATGGRFQDGFGQHHLTLNPSDTGHADITLDLYAYEDPPDRLGDSLNIIGPVPSPSTRWLSRLYLRIAREGPRQSNIGGYNTWKEKVSDGLEIVGPEAPFAFGWMDSVEVGTRIARNKFCSQFHEMDDDFVPGQEQDEANEILWDDIFTPGTRIEYFVTAAFICTPEEMYLLPDTSGAFFDEFEILPSMRLDGYTIRFPCVLYVDAYNNPTAERTMETALLRALTGAAPGEPRPDPAPWDRYDYLDASSSWCAPLFRDYSGNAGACLPQLLGYRVIVTDLGDRGVGTMDERDWQGFHDWLSTPVCSANLFRQGFYLTGDDAAEVLMEAAPGFLLQDLGANLACGAYHDPECPPGEPENDAQYCARLEDAPGSAYLPAIQADLYGNDCPPRFDFDVLSPVAGGVGGRVYRKIGTEVDAAYARVTVDHFDANYNYRAVIDGFSLHHLTPRDLENPGPESECPNDLDSVREALYYDLLSTLAWLLCRTVEGVQDLGLCVDPCYGPAGGDADDPCPTVDAGEPPASAPVDALFGAAPNPFNPRTTVRFSVKGNAPVELAIFDATGRRIRVLVSSPLAAGPHVAVWDGTDDAGHRVAAGVYWARLAVGDWSSNRRMVILR